MFYASFTIVILLILTTLQSTICMESVYLNEFKQPEQEATHRVSDPLALMSASSTFDTGVPVFPERQDAIYFIIAVRGGAKLWGRSLAKTLLDLGYPFNSPQGPPLRPIYFDMPSSGRFSSKTLIRLCEQIEGKAIAGMVVIGENQAARSLTLAGSGMNVPVLWAKGGVAKMHGIGKEVQTNLLSILQPSSREILEALRALLLQAHWHSFFILSDIEATMILSSHEGMLLKKRPLKATIYPISQQREDIFRQLARISRSTRGVVVLLCDLVSARKILGEAQRLHMVGGHFIWIWADASSNTEFFDQIVQTEEKSLDGLDFISLLNRNHNQLPKPPDMDTSEENFNSGQEYENVYTSNNNNQMHNQFQTERTNPLLKVPDSNESIMVMKRSESSLNRTKRVLPYPILDRKDERNLDFETEARLNSRQFNVSASDVMFHNFKEFPVGLLAVRPIKMTVDRSFIRASIRLFAKTWIKLEGNYDFLVQYRTKTKRSIGTNEQNNSNVIVSNHTSGLINETNTSKSNTTDHNNVKNSTRTPNATRIQKRQDSWWSLRPDVKSKTAAAAGMNLFADFATPQYRGGCFGNPSKSDLNRAELFARQLQTDTRRALSGELEKPFGLTPTAQFDLLNLVPMTYKYDERLNLDTLLDISLHTSERKWRRVGSVLGKEVQLDTIVWPGGDIVVSGLTAQPRSVFRIVTALAPPFVMESMADKDGHCLRGLVCRRVSTSGRHNLTLMFNAIETRDRLEEDALEHGNQVPDDVLYVEDKVTYKTKCCYGLSMDLLENLAAELGFEFHLYIVRDELFGTKIYEHKPEEVFRFTTESYQRKEDVPREFKIFKENEDIRSKEFFLYKEREKNYYQVESDTNKKYHERRTTKPKWNGIVGDLVAGVADMSFAPLSISKARAEVIDFSIPYFHSGVSLLAAPQSKSDIPLLAFLLPFSPELWIAIFTSLNITAIAVAVYEWLSPFGLNPWGRQRSKNFSISSALWVMWGLLCGHLVAFKAPKSWPNKFLINIWGGFSVIFIASYTANIAALIAGLFFHNTPDHYEGSLHSQRVGAPVSSVAEYYVQRNDKQLWEHMKKYSLKNIEEGIHRLKNGTLDLLMSDAPILDYYRATDHGCELKKIGDTFVEDTYAIGMKKGFPLKDSISAVIAKYSSNGYLDILTEKWYGNLPCHNNGIEIIQPRPLGVASVAGVFLLLGLGMVLGIFILIFEHWFYKYTLPKLRLKPKGTIWKSRNVMFFSQKLYRFINCVELVSPHHAARELVNTLRQGQITSLFQKSVKRKQLFYLQKEDEQRRRRKSKAQFFEMIQEIRRVQQRERDAMPTLEEVGETVEVKTTKVSPKPPKSKSPKPKLLQIPKESRSRSNSSTLSVRRYSTDSVLEERLGTIGRRLSRDVTDSPPDLVHRFETFGKGSIPETINKFDTFSGVSETSKIDESYKYDTIIGTVDDSRPKIPMKKGKKHHNKRTPLNLDIYERDRHINDTLSMSDNLYPPIFKLDRTKAVLRERVHDELKKKYPTERSYIVKRPKQSVEHIYATCSKQKKQQHQQQHPPPTPPPIPAERHSIESLSKVGRKQPRAAPRPPTRSTTSLDVPPKLPPKTISPRSRTNTATSSMSFQKLSREDLLMLSQSSESEIKQFLQYDKMHQEQ